MAILVNYPNVNLISSVYIALSNRMNHVATSFDCGLAILCQLYTQKVVTLELVVKNGHTQLIARALNAVSDSVV